MSNTKYELGVQHFALGDIDWSSDTIRAMLVTALYTPDTSAAGDEFVSAIPSGAIVQRSGPMTGKSIAGSVINCSPFTMSLVPTGHVVKYVIWYQDTGSDSTSLLILIDDTAQVLPKVTDGSDITVTPDTGPNKLFAL